MKTFIKKQANKQIYSKTWDFPGSPVVDCTSTAVGTGSIPGPGTKIPHALHLSPPPPKNQKTNYGKTQT